MRHAWLGLVALAALGCDSGRAMRPEAREAARKEFDPEAARTALTTVLDAWKRGEARSLARRSPPIRFADDDLAAGWRLDDYELARPGGPIAPLQDIPVVLTLRDRSGRTARREVSYQVATSPALAVSRSEP